MSGQLNMDFESHGLTADEMLILSVLKSGRSHAISMTELAALADTNTRHLQDVISHLIVNHKKAIGSASSPPAGYFIIETEQDLKDATKNLHNRAMSVLVRYAALKRVGFNELLHQLSLDQVNQ